MNIKLYYIEGISMIDTPSFSISYSDFGNINTQETYFNSHLVKSIESSFYPPYYKNKIKVDKDDFSLEDDSVNYLSIEYCNKIYYYFIERIEYINENVLYLHITMDVIQTFYFNIKVENGILERKFINRWANADLNDYTINRRQHPSLFLKNPYIRENVSNGKFKQVYYITDNSNTGEWFIIGIFNQYNINTSPYNVLNHVYFKVHVQNSASSLSHAIRDTKVVYFCPFDSKGTYVSETYVMLDSRNFLYKVSPCPYLDDIFVVPYNPFIGISINGQSLTINPAWDSDFADDYTVYNDQPIFGNGNQGTTEKLTCIGGNQFHLHELVNTYTFYFSKNINKGILFNTQYVPFLLDENYFSVSYGSSNSNTSYPLHTLQSTTLIRKAGVDITNGTRYYYLTDENNLNDRYGTKVLDTNVLSLQIRNDRYKEYVASNKFRWLQAMSSSGFNTISSAMYGSLKYGAPGAGLGLIEGLTQTANKITSQVLTEGNLEWTPKVSKQSQVFSSSYLESSLLITFRINVVEDIDIVALYYHNNGYLVNELIQPTSTIFGDVFNRYYFNVLKCKDTNIHLLNYIETDEIIEKIKYRLENGLRLWNVRYNDVTIGDLHYDNVEYDYL